MVPGLSKHIPPAQRDFCDVDEIEMPVDEATS